MKVFRANISPYQATNFIAKEQQALQKIESIEYTDSADDCNIVLTNTHTDVERFNHHSIQLMIHTNSGYDNFSPQFVKSAPFPIVAGNSIRALAVSQYITSAFNEHYGKIPHQDRWEPTRKWPRTLANQLDILIIGFGHIGTLVCNSLTPLGPEITIYDPYKESKPSFDDLSLEKFDAIIVTASLNPSSHHIIDQHFLSRLSDKTLIINAARGGLIDEKALITYLTNNPLSFAYLDVFEKEPFDHNTFAGLKNIRTSSHIAGVFSDIDNAIIAFEKKTIRDFLSNNNFKSQYAQHLLQNRIIGDFLI